MEQINITVSRLAFREQVDDSVSVTFRKQVQLIAMCAIRTARALTDFLTVLQVQRMAQGTPEHQEYERDPDGGGYVGNDLDDVECLPGRSIAFPNLLQVCFWVSLWCLSRPTRAIVAVSRRIDESTRSYERGRLLVHSFFHAILFHVGWQLTLHTAHCSIKWRPSSCGTPPSLGIAGSWHSFW